MGCGDQICLRHLADQQTGGVIDPLQGAAIVPGRHELQQVAFALMAVLLLVRPSGLFGSLQTR